MTWVIIVVLLLVIAAFGALLGGADAMYKQYVKRRDNFSPDAPWADPYEGRDWPLYRDAYDWYMAQPMEKLTIDSADGLRLEADYLAGQGTVTAITVHGWTDRRQGMAPYVKMFHELGLNVLAFDQRAHGASEGRDCTFGVKESDDLSRWMELLRQRGQKQFILYGVSMGAATVMMAAGNIKPDGLLCVVEDCGYTALVDQIDNVFNTMERPVPLFARRALMRVGTMMVQSRAGFAYADASPLDAIGKLSVPILFVHGDKDTFVPYPMQQVLYEACPAPRQLLSVPGAVHAQSYYTSPDLYLKTVVDFVTKHLPKAQ